MLTEAKIEYLPISEEYLYGKIIGQDIIDSETGEIVVPLNTTIDPENIELIKKLINISDKKIIIMPGSGINSDNILEFKKIESEEIHGSFIKNPNNKNSISNVDAIFKVVKLIS